MRGVGKECGELSCGEAERGVVARGHDGLSAEPRDEYHACVHAGLHERRIECDEALAAGEVLVDALADAAELANLVLLAVERLDHADACDIFLHHVVERVVGSENAVEDAAYAPHDKSERDGKDGDHGQEHKRNLPVDGKRHDPAEREHHGSAHAHADDHHVGVLHVGDIGGEACDDRAGRELVDVAKREGLHVVIHIVAQVGGEAHRGTCAHPGAAGAHSKLENGKDEQGDAKAPDLAHVAGLDAAVDEVAHDEWDSDLEYHLQDGK